MLRSMSAAISGLRNHQIYMDVVAHNIANINTYGFKSSRVNFKESLSQTSKMGFSPEYEGDLHEGGGVNPVQIGLGVTLGGVDLMMTQGSLISTGKPTDLAVSGEGFFILANKEGAMFYTRDGAFAVDKGGYMVDPVSGYTLMTATPGAGGTYTYSQIMIDPTWNWSSFSFSADGTVSGIKTDGTKDTDPAHNPGQVLLAKFNNTEGLIKVGGNLFNSGPNSGEGVPDAPGLGGRGFIVPGSLEASNVDLAEQFSRMIMAQRGFQANSRAISASDEMLQDLVNIKR